MVDGCLSYKIIRELTEASSSQRSHSEQLGSQAIHLGQNRDSCMASCLSDIVQKLNTELLSSCRYCLILVKANKKLKSKKSFQVAKSTERQQPKKKVKSADHEVRGQHGDAVYEPLALLAPRQD